VNFFAPRGLLAASRDLFESFWQHQERFWQRPEFLAASREILAESRELLVAPWGGGGPKSGKRVWTKNQKKKKILKSKIIFK